MNLKNEQVFMSKFVGNEPSSYEKRIYRAAVSQRLRNTAFNSSINYTLKGLSDENACDPLRIRKT